MLPVAFEQFAVSVTACVSVGAEMDCPIVQPKVPGGELWQFSVKFPLPLSVMLNEVQLELLNVNVAACKGDDAGTASKARVIAAAASVPAAVRTSDRFIFDS